MTSTQITAKEAEQACRDQALAEGRWQDGECQFHYDFLDENTECPTCLDDAHEAWLLARAEKPSMTPTDSTITYQLIVSRTSKEWERQPEYEVMIYRMISAGVCGPFSETATVKGMANVMILLDSWGFEQTGPPELTTTTEAFAEAVFPVAPKR